MSTIETFSHALRTLFPHTCLVCGLSLKNTIICRQCIPPPAHWHSARCLCCAEPRFRNLHEPCSTCRHLPLPYKSVRFLWLYEDRVISFISAMKYRPSLRLLDYAAQRMVDEIQVLYPGETRWDTIIPVPSSANSLKSRLFNQCEILGAGLARHLSIPLQSRILSHSGCKAPQASLSHARRIRNIRGVFHAPVDSVTGRRVLLVDDVITTGATTVAAAWALRSAGAEVIDVLALARAPRWNESRYAVYRGLQS